jgi:hypothetical protein
VIGFVLGNQLWFINQIKRKTILFHLLKLEYG